MRIVLTKDYATNILRLINSSYESIDLLCYVFKFNANKRSDKVNLIYSALREFQRKKGDVRIIIDFPRKQKPNYHPNRFSIRRLKEASISVRHIVTSSTQHAKLFIFDRSIAVSGSHNLTHSSVTNFYDISLLLDDRGLVNYFNSYFDNLFSTSRDL